MAFSEYMNFKTLWTLMTFHVWAYVLCPLLAWRPSNGKSWNTVDLLLYRWKRETSGKDRKINVFSKGAPTFRHLQVTYFQRAYFFHHTIWHKILLVKLNFCVKFILEKVMFCKWITCRLCEYVLVWFLDSLLKISWWRKINQ